MPPSARAVSGPAVRHTRKQKQNGQKTLNSSTKSPRLRDGLIEQSGTTQEAKTARARPHGRRCGADATTIAAEGHPRSLAPPQQRTTAHVTSRGSFGRAKRPQAVKAWFFFARRPPLSKGPTSEVSEAMPRDGLSVHFRTCRMSTRVGRAERRTSSMCRDNRDPTVAHTHHQRAVARP